jgi:hypothetical protein
MLKAFLIRLLKEKAHSYLEGELLEVKRMLRQSFAKPLWKPIRYKEV